LEIVGVRYVPGLGIFSVLNVIEEEET